MNVKSRFDASEDPVKEPKKRYYWLGYGQVNDTAGRARLMGGIWDIHTFDLFFEKLGLKKKHRPRSDGKD